MTEAPDPALDLQNFEPDTETFLNEVLEGLKQEPKLLHCKYLYDERGSQLFDEICQLEEYYPTRTELAIMQEFAPDIAEAMGPRCMLVEYGSGSSVKIRLLLDELKEPAAYVPLDISREHLVKSAVSLAADYPDLEILPVCADYTADFDLPTPTRPAAHCVGYFPGSTIGNFHKPEALDFLRHVADTVGKGGGLLIGVDLRKDRETLEAAYNDARGVTAEFNFNLLRRLNRELGADFDLDAFDFKATWNDKLGRIESHLISRRDQTVHIGDEAIEFNEGERIRTECSYKYTIAGFAELAGQAGFEQVRVWTDSQQRFSVQYLVAA